MPQDLVAPAIANPQVNTKLPQESDSNGNTDVACPQAPYLDLPCDAALHSQPLSQPEPLCTPLDLVMEPVNPSVLPPSPAAKRGFRGGHRSHRDHHTSRSYLQPDYASQESPLPDMSQDTLALFPNIVAEYAVAEGNDQSCGGETFVAQYHQHDPTSGALEAGFGNFLPLPGPSSICSRPPKHPAPPSVGIAKASLLVTLHSHPTLHNHFLPSGPTENKSDQEQVQSSAVKYSFGASDSFDASLEKNNTPFKTNGRRRNNGTQVASLKTSIVASSQPHSSLLHFAQVGKPIQTAFSTITRATSRMDGVTYALKRNIKPYHSVSEQLAALQEVFALAALQKIPHVLRYYSSWWEGGGKHLVVQCEWVKGGCVSGKLSFSELCKLGLSVARSLKAMHTMGIVHLDIKPENIFRGERDGKRAYLIADFGLAHKIDENGAAVESSLGMRCTDGRSQEGDARYLCPEALDIDAAPGNGNNVYAPPSDSESQKSSSTGHTSQSIEETSFDSDVIMPSSSALRHAHRPIKRRRRSLTFLPAESDDESTLSQPVYNSKETFGSNNANSRRTKMDLTLLQSDDESSHIRDVIPTESHNRDPMSILNDQSNGENGTKLTEWNSANPRPGIPQDSCSVRPFASTKNSSVNLVPGHATDPPSTGEYETPCQTQETAMHDLSQFSNPESTLRKALTPNSSPKILTVNKVASTTGVRDLRAADVFSFGATLYELATGEDLAVSGSQWIWLRNSPDEVFRRVQRTTGSESFASIIRDCLARDASSRPSTTVLESKLSAISHSTDETTVTMQEQFESLRAQNVALREALAQLLGNGQSDMCPEISRKHPGAQSIDTPVRRSSRQSNGGRVLRNKVIRKRRQSVH